MEVNSLYFLGTIYFSVIKKDSGEFWDSKIKVHQRMILAVLEKKSSELEQRGKKPQHFKTL